jgi:hypothetical protein
MVCLGARPPGGFVVPSPTSVVIFMWVLISASAAAAASDSEHGVATARENALAQVSGSSSPRMKLQIVAVAAQTCPFFYIAFCYRVAMWSGSRTTAAPAPIPGTSRTHDDRRPPPPPPHETSGIGTGTAGEQQCSRSNCSSRVGYSAAITFCPVNLFCFCFGASSACTALHGLLVLNVTMWL